MSWQKSDGAKIKITFTQTLTGDATGQQSHFTVTVPEYTYIPDGTLQNVEKVVASTRSFAGVKEIIDLGGGTFTDVVCTDGLLTLEVAP